jgi:hypothetical protein
LIEEAMSSRSRAGGLRQGEEIKPKTQSGFSQEVLALCVEIVKNLQNEKKKKKR